MVVYLRKRSPNRLLPRHCNKLRNKPTCRHSSTQRLVSWSSPVVPKVWTKTQRRVEKGQKIGRAEAIETAVVDFQCYLCLSVYSVDTVLEKRVDCDIKNELSNMLPKIIHTINIYFIRCLRLGSRGVHQIQIWVVLKKVWELSGGSLSLNLLMFEWKKPID